MLIAESQQIERIVAAVTNYVARRLVERERAFAAEGLEDAPQPKGWPTRPAASVAATRRFAGREPPEAAKARRRPSPRRSRRETSWVGESGSAFAFLLMTLGSVTLICLLALGFYLAWTLRLRAVWAHWFGQPPF